MARFLTVRISLIVVTLLAVSVAIFLLIELVPGDAAQVMLGQQATPESLRGLREQMGLDRPPHIRYLDWIWNAVRGDLGVSAKVTGHFDFDGHRRSAGKLGAAGDRRVHNRRSIRSGSGRLGRHTG